MVALIYSLTFIHYFSIIMNNKSNRCNYLAIKAPVHKETKNSAITIIYIKETVWKQRKEH